MSTDRPDGAQPGSATEYPRVERTDDVTTLPDGSTVANPHSGLQKDGPEREKWRLDEEQLRQDHLDPEAVARAQALYDAFKGIPQISAPIAAGGRHFYTVMRPGATHPSLVVREADGSARLVVEELRVSSPGSLARGWYPSPRDASGRQYVAYAQSGTDGGEMNATLIVRDVDTGELCGEYPHAGFASVAWAPDAESLVASEMFAAEGEAAKFRKYHFRLVEHRVGAPPDQAREIHIRDDQPAYADRRPVLISPDGRWLVVRQSTGGGGASAGIFLQDRRTGENVVVQPDDGVTDWVPQFDDDSNLWLWTNQGNGLGRVVTVDLSQGPRTVRDGVVAVPEHPSLLLESFAVLSAPGRPPRVAAVMVDRGQIPQLWIVDPQQPDATVIVEAPGVIPVRDEAGRHLGHAGEMRGLSYDPAHPDLLWTSFSDMVSPSDVFEIDIRTGAVANVTKNAPALHARLPVPAVEAVMYETPSLDGTVDVSHMLVRHLDRDRPGTLIRPVLSFGYGAYRSVVPLAFKQVGYSQPIALYLGFNVSTGGPRGGGDRGREWWEQGRGVLWNNTVLDRVAIERDQDARGLTRPDRRVRIGASAAGPDIVHLAARFPDEAAVNVAVNSAGGFADPKMRTFNRRISEYGDPHDPEQLRALLDRDPELLLRGLPPQDAARMNTLLVVAAMGDDRVSPAAAMRLVAAGQDAVRGIPGAGPVLFHGSVGGHTWTATPTGVGIIAVSVHSMGTEIRPALRIPEGAALDRSRAADVARHPTTMSLPLPLPAGPTHGARHTADGPTAGPTFGTTPGNARPPASPQPNAAVPAGLNTTPARGLLPLRPFDVKATAPTRRSQLNAPVNPTNVVIGAGPAAHPRAGKGLGPKMSRSLGMR